MKNFLIILAYGLTTYGLGWIASSSHHTNPAPNGIQVRLVENQQTGDYKLYVSGGRQTVCEEKDVKVIQQPDAVTDLVIECSHVK